MQNDSEYLTPKEFARELREGIYDAISNPQNTMTTKEAKDIIINDPSGDIVKRMEAIAVARSILGEDCTMEQIWRWAEGGNNGKEKA